VDVDSGYFAQVDPPRYCIITASMSNVVDQVFELNNNLPTRYRFFEILEGSGDFKPADAKMGTFIFKCFA